jgi:hypothetical protein
MVFVCVAQVAGTELLAMWPVSVCLRARGCAALSAECLRIRTVARHGHSMCSVYVCQRD